MQQFFGNMQVVQQGVALHDGFANYQFATPILSDAHSREKSANRVGYNPDN